MQVFDKGSAYLHTGMYTFALGQGEDRAPLKARFSMMWRKHSTSSISNYTWKITHMHSSVRPAEYGTVVAQDIKLVAKVSRVPEPLDMD
jgi:hypothetical protein